MDENVTATLAEPTAGLVTSEAPPRDTAPSEGSSSTAERPAHVVDSSKAWARLYRENPEAEREFRLTGNLPPDVEEELDTRPTLNENEAVIADMSKEEKKNWRASGDVPHRHTQEGKQEAEARAAEKAEKTKKESESRHEFAGIDSPIAKFVVLNERDTAKATTFEAEQAKGHPARLAADQQKYSAQDREAVSQAYFSKAYPELVKMTNPQEAKSFIDSLKNLVEPMLHAPYSFWREFAMNESFRKEIIKANFLGNDQIAKVKKTLSIISRFDAQHAPPPPRRDPPAPATRLAARDSMPSDEEGSAVNAGEFRRYMRAANRADQLRHFGK